MNNYTNKLINEKSPYLLQHAHNPVNWYPWGNEAFNKAKNENKPIFLSIGYSTCHWCHVMERESFEDIEIANILNSDFVSIKVDREERPDIDHIYMNVCQALTGSSGWPLIIFMTYDKKPFYAGTYFPKCSNYGIPGLIDVLEATAIAWKNNHDDLIASCNYITGVMEGIFSSYSNKDINKDILESSFNQFENNFDQTFGGFGFAPKFPTPHNLLFLLRYWYNTGSPKALSMVEKTLTCMYCGGIYDHIGFGFSRYSTDNKWLVPHFEKMLYDNALISIAYLEAYQATKNQLYAKAARDIFSYIGRDMTSPDGGFYSAEDADSEGVEGKFYLWDYDEVINLLGDVDGSNLCRQYNITPKGNFEGKNIPNLINSQNLYMNETIREKLFNYRNKKIHPYKDDKILTSWNALMTAALSIGGRILNDKKYINLAENAIKFIYNNLFNENGRLLARFREGHSSFYAYAEDYAFMIWALIETYESTFNADYLHKAISLNNDLIKYFWDDENGGLFLYGSDSEQLISRPKEVYDGAAPSANSVAALNWLRLSRLTGNQEYSNLVSRIFKTFGESINNIPISCTYMLSAYSFSISKSSEIVIVGDINSSDTQDMIKIINNKYNPYTTVVVKPLETDDILNTARFISDYIQKDGSSTAYICRNFSCMEPITSINQFEQAINNFT